jgi:FixJ family two-component response regulator
VPAGAEPFTVFIIDDDASVRGGLSRLMRSAGFEARAYASPADFLQNASPTRRGVVLLDITMPGMSGAEVHARLGDLDWRLPVIVVSATENSETRDTAHALGASFFLRKPADDQALLDAIEWVTHTPTQAGPSPLKPHG